MLLTWQFTKSLESLYACVLLVYQQNSAYTETFGHFQEKVISAAVLNPNASVYAYIVGKQATHIRTNSQDVNS